MKDGRNFSQNRDILIPIYCLSSVKSLLLDPIFFVYLLNHYSKEVLCLRIFFFNSNEFN